MISSSPKRVFASALACALLLGASGRARAVENRYNVHFEIGPLVVLDQPNFVDVEKLVADTGVHLRLSFEMLFTEWVGLDLGWEPDITFAKFGSGSDAQQHLLVGARFRPWWNKRQVYVAQRGPDEKFHAGDLLSDVWLDAHADIVPSGGTRIGYDVGVGTRVPVYAPFQVGVFVRFSNIFAVDGSFDSPHYKMLSAGVIFSAGFLPVHSEPDSDGDGVPDSRDKCPGTPKGTAVNAAGCPVVPESKEMPRCSDTDLDGVCDGQDQCPDTPFGTPVDANGCPIGGAQPTTPPETVAPPKGE